MEQGRSPFAEDDDADATPSTRWSNRPSDAARRIVEAARGTEQGPVIDLRQGSRPDVAGPVGADENGAVADTFQGGTARPSGRRSDEARTVRADRPTVATEGRHAPRLTLSEVGSDDGPAFVSLSDTTDPKIRVPSSSGSVPLDQAFAPSPPPVDVRRSGNVRDATPVDAPSADRADMGRQGRESQPRDPQGSQLMRNALFLVALGLAVAAGVLGALWQRERDTAEELRAELAAASEADADVDRQIADLVDESRALQLRNDQLLRDLAELETMVPEVDEGRIVEIDAPFQPFAVDENRGRVIAMDPAGEFVVWGDGTDAQITDVGLIPGPPVAMFAHRDNAWVSTEKGEIVIFSLINGSPVFSVPDAKASLMVPSRRTVWSYEAGSRELRRHRTSNGNVTATVSLPVDVIELSSGAGAVWALGSDGLVYRVNTADLTVTALPAGQEVVAIAAGNDALWALSAADGSLRRLDAVSGEVLVTVPVGRDPIDVEFSGSSAWVALRSGEWLIEVDTRTSAVVSRTSLPSVPLRLTAGATGVLVTLGGDTPLVQVSSGEDTDDLADADLVDEQADG